MSHQKKKMGLTKKQTNKQMSHQFFRVVKQLVALAASLDVVYIVTHVSLQRFA